MNVSIPRLTALIDDGTRTGRWPRHAERLQAKSQGDYEFGGDITEHFLARLDGLDDDVPLATLLPTLDDPLWGGSYPHLFGYHQFFIANLLTAARVGEASVATTPELVTTGAQVVSTSLVVEGDVDAAHPLVVCGDLRVGGDVRTTRSTIVCGNIDVGGRWLGRDDFSAHAICGDATFGEALLIRGELFVAGHTRAPAVFVNNPHYVGFLRSLDGLTAALCIECALDGEARSRIDGAVDVAVALPRNLAGPDDPPDVVLATLGNLTDEAPQRPEDVRPFLDGWMARLFDGAPLHLKKG